MTRSDRESKGYGNGRPPLKQQSLLNTVLARGDDELAWQHQGACAQEGALDEYATNPFDSASYLIEDKPEEVEALFYKFCNRCPVVSQCLSWAEADKAYAGMAAGRIWGRKGGRGLPVLQITTKKIAERKNDGQ